MEITSYEPGTPCWTDLGVPEVVAASEFYAALFGWNVEEPGPESGGYRMCTLRGKPVAALSPQFQEGMPPYWATYVSVKDADATADAARNAGGQVLMGPMNIFDEGRMAVFVDTTGAPISVWQPKRHVGAELVNETGTVCWHELNTRQPEQATEFYRATFGWDAATQQMGSTTYTEWKVGDRTVAGMIPMDQRWPADLPSHWLVYFAVDDADATAAHVRERGGTVHVPPMDVAPGRFSVVGDPQGAAFGVIKLNPM
jgi:uncharacterized protein